MLCYMRCHHVIVMKDLKDHSKIKNQLSSSFVLIPSMSFDFQIFSGICLAHSGMTDEGSEKPDMAALI